MASTITSFDGTVISLVDSGGDGPAVVLLHGVTQTSELVWEKRIGRDDTGRFVLLDGQSVASRLRDAGARTILIDARGHGHSGRSPDPDRYRGDAHVRDVRAVMDHLDLDQVDLVGYSMGAMTAARMLGVGEHRLRSVTLCGTGPRHIQGGDDAFVDFLAELGRVYQQDAWNERPDLKGYRAFTRLDPVHDFESIGAASIGLEQVPIERLQAASVPVLVLNASNDDRDGGATRVAAFIPGATAQIAGDADHATAPSDDAFQSALMMFVRSQWAG